MRPKFLLSALAGLGLVAIGAADVFQCEKVQLLRVKAAQTEVRLKERSRLADENDRIMVELAAWGDLKKLGQAAGQAQQLRDEIAKLRLAIRNADLAEAGPGAAKPDPVWPDGAEVLPAKDWAFVGNAHPRDALQSLLWASTSGNVEQLSRLITFHGDALQSAQALFDHLPASAQAEYGSAEKVVATMIAAAMPTDLEAASIDAKEIGPMAMVTVRDQHSDASQTDLHFRADKTADGWKLAVPAKLIDSFQKKLSGS